MSYTPPLGVYLGDGLDPWIMSEIWLDGPGGSFKPVLDCGPIAVAMALQVQSGGRFHLIGAPDTSGVIANGTTKCTGSIAGAKTHHDKALNLIYLTRQYAVASCNGGLTMQQLCTAYKAFTAEFTSIYLGKPKATLFVNAAFDTSFLTAMSVAGAWAVVGVWYPSLIADEPGHTGYCTTVATRHYIVVGEYDGTYFTTLDSLCDGRASSSCGGGDVAAGAQRIHKTSLRSACGKWLAGGGSSTGNVSAFVTMPSVDLGLPDYCATTLAAASSGGDSNFKVATVAGMYAGDPLQVGQCPDTEQLVILTVGTAGSGGTGVTATAGAAHAHASGDPLLTGGYTPDPPCVSDGFAGWDPCNDSA